jgi:hypothetical protein
MQCAMKKIMLTLCLMIMSASSFAIVNFSTGTGALVMRDVVVDDTTVYDSVTLQLNLADGTFTILDATLKDTSFSNTVIDSVAENGLKVDFYGCTLSGRNQVTCMTKIVALNQDLNILAGGSTQNSLGFLVFSSLFDNLSNGYEVSTTTALDRAGTTVNFGLIQGIPVEVKFIFNNINPQATSISSFRPSFDMSGTGFRTISVVLDFRDIDF